MWLRRVSHRQGFAFMRSFPFTLRCSMCCWQNMPSYRFRRLPPLTVACRLCEGQSSLNGESMMDQGLIGDQRRGAVNGGAASVRFSAVAFLSNVCAHGGSKSRSVTPLRLASCLYELQPCQVYKCMSCRFASCASEVQPCQVRKCMTCRFASCASEVQPCQRLSCCVACALPAVEIAERVIHRLIPAAQGLRHIILFDLT